MSEIKTKIQCDKCGFWFSARGGNFNKHYEKCDGSYKPFIKSNCCKYCGYEFTDDMTSTQRASHVKWCEFNPKKQKYIDDASNRIKEISKERSKETLDKIKKGISDAHKAGRYKHVNHKTFLGKKHTEETKEKLRQKALASKHRRILRSTVKYIKTDGTEVLLDSSWEVALATRLDHLSILWIRPEPIKWIDSNNIPHNYFPDFYLPEYNIFLDPKNDIVYNKSLEKIEAVTKLLPNLYIIRTLKECQDFNPQNIS